MAWHKSKRLVMWMVIMVLAAQLVSRTERQLVCTHRPTPPVAQAKTRRWRSFFKTTIQTGFSFLRFYGHTRFRRELEHGCLLAFRYRQ